MRIVALVLAAAAIVAAVLGFAVAVVLPPPTYCFEVCSIDSWQASVFAVVFALSAVINLALLAGAIGQGGTLRLGSVVLSQFGVVLFAAGWVVATRGRSYGLQLLAGTGVAVLSVVVCVLVVRALRRPGM